MLTDEDLAAIEARPRSDGILGPLASHLVDTEETIDALIAEVSRLRAQPTEERPTGIVGYCVCDDGHIWPDCGIPAHRQKAREMRVPAPTEEPTTSDAGWINICQLCNDGDCDDCRGLIPGCQCEHGVASPTAEESSANSPERTPDEADRNG